MIKNNAKFKDGFSIVTAIFVIFIMASLTTLIMNVTSKTVKETTQQYQKEQASLLARSYTELAMLYVINYDRIANNNCIEEIHADFGDPNNLYKIDINLQYIGSSILIPNCTKLIYDLSTTNSIGFNSTISVIIDVYVKYKDFDDLTNRYRTFHRRTVQKL
jgi:type II secretory pathway pseudopilin PulG